MLTGFGYDPAMRADQGRAVAAMLPQVRDIRRFGAASLDLFAVAAGQADAYLEEGLNVWDDAAGALVATEAGARVEVLRGPHGRRFVVCAPADGFDDLVDLARRCGLLTPS